MTTIYIYGLHAPDDDTIMYVGKSKSPIRRLSTHIREAADVRSTGKKNEWLRGLIRQNITPMVKILDTCDDADAADVEFAWIQEHSRNNLGLTNRNHMSGTGQPGAPRKLSSTGEDTRICLPKINRLIGDREDKQLPHSVQYIAKETGVNKGVIRKMIARQPSGYTYADLRALCAFFGCTENQFLYGQPKEAPNDP